MLLVDVEALLRDGVIGPEQAEEIRARARARLVALVIEALTIAGVAAVVAGTCVLLNDAGAIALFGAAVTGAALVALARLGAWAGLVGNAAAAIGVAMLAIGGALRLDDLGGPAAVAGFGLGLGLVGAGLLLRGGGRLRFAAGAMVLAGALAHLAGLTGLEPGAGWVWLVLLYAGALGLAVGVATDLRAVSFLAVVPLVSVPGARGLSSHGGHGPLFDEPAVTILWLSLLGGAAMLWARRSAPRWGRHGAALALAAFLGINLAFWVGSIRGDVVGLHLWGPSWEDVVAGATGERWPAWRAAQAAFEAEALVLPAWGFALAWAGLLVGLGIAAARGVRREAVNMAASFGALHGFTQYFLHIDATPGSIALAGLIAIGVAAGLWRLNRALPAGGRQEG